MIVHSALVLLLASLSSCFATTNPTQVHIALAGADDFGNSNTMAVSWQTQNNTRTSQVLYGLESGKYDYSSLGTSKAYYQTFHHHVVLQTLVPDTTYFYIVGDSAGGFSSEFSFTSAPLSSTNVKNFTFAVFADLGLNLGDSTINFLKTIESDLDLLWHGGDVSYADDSFLHSGCVTEFCYENVWDDYMTEIEPIASKIPYMTAVGNHEVECHDPACLTDPIKRKKLSNFSAYNTRFRMPSPESKGTLNMHFSFNYGPVHFISIDTETGYPGAAEETHYVLPCGGFDDQLSWLRNDLMEANQNRASRPWIFVQGHHPMYQGKSINAEFQAAMEDLFNEFGVDIYFSGHVHSYERDYPVYRGVLDPNGYTNPAAPTYLMIGGAGNDEMHGAQIAAAKKTGAEFVEPKPILPGYSSVTSEGSGKWRASTQNGEWTAVTDADYFGVGKVTIIDESTLEFQYYRTSEGVLHDSFVLQRDHSVFVQKFSK